MQAILIVVIIVIVAAGGWYLLTPPAPTPPPPTTTTQLPPTTTAPPPPVKKIAVVSDIGGRGDLSFNDMAFKGGAEAEKAFGVTMVELISKSEADYVPNLETAAKDKDVILVVGVGFLLTDAITDVATRYPNQNFAIIDGFVPGMANVMSILYEEHKGSAIVGAIAALVAAQYGYKYVGVVLGIEIPVLWKFEIGYKWGVDWALKWYQSKFGKPAPVISGTPIKNRVLWTYTGTFSDVTKGYEAAKAMYAKGAVATYNVAGPLGLGLNQAVQESDSEGSYEWAAILDRSRRQPRLDQSWIRPLQHDEAC